MIPAGADFGAAPVSYWLSLAVAVIGFALIVHAISRKDRS